MPPATAACVSSTPDRVLEPEDAALRRHLREPDERSLEARLQRNMVDGCGRDGWRRHLLDARCGGGDCRSVGLAQLLRSGTCRVGRGIQLREARYPLRRGGRSVPVSYTHLT